MKIPCDKTHTPVALKSARNRLHHQRMRLYACLATIMISTVHATTSAADATEENAPVVVPPAEVAKQFPPGHAGLGSPLLVLPAQRTWLAVPQAAIQRSTNAGWSEEQSLALSSNHELLVQRTRSRSDQESATETVERLVLTPKQPWTAELEIRYPFRLDFPQHDSSSGGDESADSEQRFSLVLPLRNGWARRLELGNDPVSAEYRLGDTLTGNETLELALPVIQIDGPGHCQAAVMADPRFSALFIVHVSEQVLEGEIRYRFRGDRVPIKQRNQTLCLERRRGPKGPQGRHPVARFHEGPGCTNRADEPSGDICLSPSASTGVGLSAKSSRVPAPPGRRLAAIPLERDQRPHTIWL